jgi:hypothetical protein
LRRGRRPTAQESSLTDLTAGAEAVSFTPEKWQARYEACQRGIAELGETLDRVSPDIVVIAGDGQEELFSDENMPAVLVCWGETILNIPHHLPESASPALRASAWGNGEEERNYPVAAGLGQHLIECLIEAGFDVAAAPWALPSGLRQSSPSPQTSFRRPVCWRIRHSRLRPGYGAAWPQCLGRTARQDLDHRCLATAPLLAAAKGLPTEPLPS